MALPEFGPGQAALEYWGMMPVGAISLWPQESNRHHETVRALGPHSNPCPSLGES